jgi:competence protein ComEC
VIKQVNNIRWDQQPLVRLLLPLLAGLGISTYFNMEQHHACLYCIILIVWGVVFFRRKKLHLSWVNGFIIAALFFLVGVLLNLNARTNTLEAFYDVPHLYKIEAVGASMHTAKGYKFEARLTQIIIDQQSLKLNANVMIYVHDKAKKTASIDLNADYWLHAVIKRPASSDYPGAFNYQDYLRNKGIYGIIYAQADDFFELKPRKNRVLTYITAWRTKLLDILNSFCPDVNVRAIAGALLFGARSEMSQELKQAYSTAGLVHVLAVSGMHVSMVCSLLLWIFDRFGRSKNKTLYCLPFVWGYALLTGMSSSVVRAVVMISFIILGKRFFKVRTSTNLLAATAFSLLIYKPLYFFDLGAQLSFAAVWGIQFLGQPSGMRSKKGIKNHIMDLLRVCVVAQLATLPLTLYYFGNFPVYFLLANIIAVPLSSLIIYIGVAGYFIHFLLPKFTVLFQIMGLGIQLLNSYSLFISHLPLAQLTYLAFNSRLLLILTCFLFILALKPVSLIVRLKLGLTIAIVVSICSFVKQLHTNEMTGFIIFDERHSMVGFKTETQFIEIESDVIAFHDVKIFDDYKRFKQLHWEGLNRTLAYDATNNRIFRFFNTNGVNNQTMYLAMLPHPKKVDFEKMLSKGMFCVIAADNLHNWDKAKITEVIRSKTGRSPLFYKRSTRGLIWYQK